MMITYIVFFLLTELPPIVRASGWNRTNSFLHPPLQTRPTTVSDANKNPQSVLVRSGERCSTMSALI